MHVNMKICFHCQKETTFFSTDTDELILDFLMFHEQKRYATFEFKYSDANSPFINNN